MSLKDDLILMHQQVKEIQLEKHQALAMLAMSFAFGPYATVCAGVISRQAMFPAIVIGALQWCTMWLLGFGYLWAIKTCWTISKNKV